MNSEATSRNLIAGVFVGAAIAGTVAWALAKFFVYFMADSQDRIDFVVNHIQQTLALSTAYTINMPIAKMSLVANTEVLLAPELDEIVERILASTNWTVHRIGDNFVFIRKLKGAPR